jgi:PncC family amidohydrolase
VIPDRLIHSTQQVARNLARLLTRYEKRIVLAESCTAGLISAVIAQTPGISKWLCGSAVTYQSETKSAWLGLDQCWIEKYSGVSVEITRDMALAVLKKTQQADFAVAITGHLERGADPSGCQVFVAIAERRIDDMACVFVGQHKLEGASRVARQWQAARFALHAAVDNLNRQSPPATFSFDWMTFLREELKSIRSEPG